MTAGLAMTAEEFLALPETESSRFTSLVEGELVVNDPAALHGHLQGNLFFALESWARSGPKRGSTVFPRDIQVDERNVFKPDVLWYAHGRVPDRHSPPPYSMPDLAVEVRSPSTWRYDVGAKKSAYERRGLPELWLVDTAAEAVLVFRRSAPDARTFDVALELTAPERLSSPLMPGFELPVAGVFS